MEYVFFPLKRLTATTKGVQSTSHLCCHATLPGGPSGKPASSLYCKWGQQAGRQGEEGWRRRRKRRRATQWGDGQGEIPTGVRAQLHPTSLLRPKAPVFHLCWQLARRFNFLLGQENYSCWFPLESLHTPLGSHHTLAVTNSRLPRELS